MNSRIVVGLGELLWDMFPAGKKLGGAPANFAYISNLLGDRGVVASRVGDQFRIETDDGVLELSLPIHDFESAFSKARSGK